MAVTTGMVGHGFYDQNSGPQWAATEVVLPWLEAAVAEMALAAHQPRSGSPTSVAPRAPTRSG